MLICPYFDDLQVLGGSLEPQCRAVVQDGRFAHYAVQLILATPRRPLDFAVDGAPLQRLRSAHWSWHHPARRYRYHAPRPGDWWSHCWIAFRGPRGQRLIEEGFDALGPTGLIPVRRPALARALFARAVAAIGRSGEEGRAVLAIEDLLLCAQADAVPAADSDPLAGVIAGIDADPAVDFDSRQAAADLGWSYDHFRRRFRERTGVAPWAYLLQRRLQMAATALRSGEEAVATIASRCGFGDAAQFARHFRRHWGQSPSAFRSGSQA